MSQAATFSEIFYSAYGMTRSFLMTYIYGSLLLIVAVMAGRGLGTVLLGILGTPQFEGKIGTQVAIGFVAVILIIVGVIAQMLQQVFGLVLAVERKQEVIETLKKSLRVLLPLIGGGLWLFFRSFSWVILLSAPFFALGQDNILYACIGGAVLLAGLGCMLYFLPRLSFTNVIQLRDGTGIRASAELSLGRTYGYWGKIVGNNLLFSLCMMLSMAAAFAIILLPVGVAFGLHYAGSDLLALLVSIPLGIAALLAAFLFFFGIALFSQAYVVELYDTIVAHPIPKKAA